MAFLIASMMVAQLSAGWNSPTVINRRLACSDAGRQPVLIYYANETHLDRRSAANHRSIVQQLLASPRKPVQELARTIEADRTKFAKVVHSEVAAFKNCAGKTGIGFAIFTNRLAVKGRFLYRLPGGEFQFGRLPLAKRTSLFYASHPLAHPGGLSTALTQVARQFAPSRHRFILLVKSHGTKSRILVPRIGVSAKRLAQHRTNRIAKSGTRMRKKGDLGTSTSSNLGTANSSNLGTASSSQLGANGKELLTGHIGTRKAQFADSLDQLTQTQGMTFQAVILEACNSQLTATQTQRLRSSVGILYTSDAKGLPYRSIDYRMLLQTRKPGEPLVKAIEKQLNP